jgi:predicted Zn-dependent protease with MMP-like domain
MIVDVYQRVRLIVAGVGVAAILGSSARTAVAGGNVQLAIVFALLMLLTVAAISVVDQEEEPEPPRAFGAGGERWSMSDDEFESLVREVETARSEEPARMDDFDRLVIEAIDELPGWVQAELEANVSVIVATDGDDPANYGHADKPALLGLYVGNWLGADPRQGARIVLFKDTLIRLFEDPEELKREIAVTLRHEIAHHFGADEEAVRRLGL